MADISVTNTSAGVSGKAMLMSDVDATVTALHTFNRGSGSAPLAVGAGAAVVTNLDADKLDGAEGATYLHKTNDAVWSSYTPVWGNTGTANTTTGSTITGKYMTLGKIVFFKVALVWGVGTVAGSSVFTFTLPVTAANTGAIAGAATISDVGSGTYAGSVVILSTTTAAVISSDVINNGVSGSVPMTWSAANADQIQFSGFYEIA